MRTTVDAELVHVNVVSAVLPRPVFAVAVTCTAVVALSWARYTMPLLSKLIPTTESFRTVTSHSAEITPDVAVIVAVPCAMAFTSPVEVTVATSVSEDAHTTEFALKSSVGYPTAVSLKDAPS